MPAGMRRTHRAPDHEDSGPKELLLRMCVAPQDLGVTCGPDCAVRQAHATTAAWAESRTARHRQWAEIGRGPPVAFPVELSVVAAPVTSGMLGETKRARFSQPRAGHSAPSRGRGQGGAAHAASVQPFSHGLGRSDRRLRRPPRLGGPYNAEPAVLRPNVRSVGTLSAKSPFTAAYSRSKEIARPVTAPQAMRIPIQQPRPVHYVDRGAEVQSMGSRSIRDPSVLEPASRCRPPRPRLHSHVLEEQSPRAARQAHLSSPFLVGGTIRARSDTIARLEALADSSRSSSDGPTIADVWRRATPKSSLRATQLHRPFTSPVRHPQEPSATVLPPVDATRVGQRFWDSGDHDQRWVQQSDTQTFGPSLLVRSLRKAERHKHEAAAYSLRLQHRLDQAAKRAATLGAAREAARARLREQYTRSVLNGRKP